MAERTDGSGIRREIEELLEEIGLGEGGDQETKSFKSLEGLNRYQRFMAESAIPYTLAFIKGVREFPGYIIKEQKYEIIGGVLGTSVGGHYFNSPFGGYIIGYMIGSYSKEINWKEYTNRFTKTTYRLLRG